MFASANVHLPTKHPPSCKQTRSSINMQFTALLFGLAATVLAMQELEPAVTPVAEVEAAPSKHVALYTDRYHSSSNARKSAAKQRAHLAQVKQPQAAPSTAQVALFKAVLVVLVAQVRALPLVSPSPPHQRLRMYVRFQQF